MEHLGATLVVTYSTQVGKPRYSSSPTEYKPSRNVTVDVKSYYGIVEACMGETAVMIGFIAQRRSAEMTLEADAG